MRWAHWLVGSELLLLSCVSANAVSLGLGHDYPPLPADSVHVFISEEDVPASFLRIALVFAEVSSELGNEAKLVHAMRKKAGELGADGIILTTIGEGYPNSLFDLGEEHRAQGIAIRFKR